MIRAMLKYIILFVGFISTTAIAQSDISVRPADLECVLAAAQRQQVPANVLLAISSIEMGKNGQAVRNKNGSYDFGHFQVNSIHFGKDGLFTKMGIRSEDALWRGCYNAELAAYLLRLRLNEQTGQDFWTKAANYHSKTPAQNRRYKSKLIPLSRDWANFLASQYRNVHVIRFHP